MSSSDNYEPPHPFDYDDVEVDEEPADMSGASYDEWGGR